jgi:peptide/nickel transport system substrate-binding protein
MGACTFEVSRRALLAGAAIAASGIAAPAIAQAKTRTIRYRATADLVTLDPVATISTPAFEAAYLIYDYLFALDASLTPRPQMVESYEQSVDGLNWRFALRDGLFFHDGEMARAQDAVASIARWARRDRIGLMLAQRLDGMSAIDDRRFEIRLKRRFPRILLSLATPSLFVMPERVAVSTDPATPVKDHTGSGPFVFLADEWVAGAKAAFRRNERYQPRQEPPSLLAGGKAAFVDRVEWSTIPDTSTATAALQNNEIDWIFQTEPDLIPVLEKNEGVRIARVNPFGATGALVFNTWIPPFDNAALRRALLSAVNQDDCMRAVVGDRPALMHTGVGVFAPGTPLASDVGTEVLTAPRDLDQARHLVRESGYRDERIVMMVPTDIAALFAFGNVIHETMKNIGLNMEYQAMDWGTIVSRRAQMTTGVWHCHISINPGWNCSPATHFFLSSPYHRDPRMLELLDVWVDAPDLAAEKQVADDIQRRFFENPSILPLGQYYLPSAFRNALSDIVQAPWALFWGLRKA